MLVVLVDVAVRPENIEDFVQATIENARQSVEEPGITRFDVLRHEEDPARFTLVEVYRDSEAPAKHKETAHYQKWRDAVAGMMARPRESAKFHNVYPDEAGW